MRKKRLHLNSYFQAMEKASKSLSAAVTTVAFYEK
jgi:hypothetical protein